MSLKPIKFYTGINLKNNKVSNISDGTETADAVNKGQLDDVTTLISTSISEAVTGLKDSVGSLVVYNNSVPLPVDVSGLPAGTTFSNTPIADILTNLLYPYQKPTFSVFKIQGLSTLIDVGYSLPTTLTFEWATTNPSNIKNSSVIITDVTNNNVLLSGLSTSGTDQVTVSAISKTINSSHTFQIQGIDKNNNTVFTQNFIIYWQWLKYYGENLLASNLTETELKTLRVSTLSSPIAGTYVFNSGGYKLLAYPTSFGLLTTFKDQATNLTVPFNAPYTISITNRFNVTTTYYVYKTKNILNGSINIIVS